MTATDELRRLLDERCVEHYDGTETTLWGYTQTSDSTGMYRYAADETLHGLNLWMNQQTPEQAVEATLGRGTCHRNWRKDGYAFCSECGYNITGPWAHWCPNCGRKVEQ